MKRVVLFFLCAVLAFSLPAPAGAAEPGEATEATQLAFVRKNQIYTVSTDGTDERRLTWRGKSYRPHWSPNGRKIAFVHEVDGLRDLWVMRADGTRKRRLTRLGSVSEPAWSPDGRWLAFGGTATSVGSRDNNGGVLHKVRSKPNRGAPVPLLGSYSPGGYAEELFVDTALDWSRDGSSIAFYSDVFPSSPDHYLLSYSLAEQEVSVLGAIGGSCCGEGFFGDPAWTPDGQHVLATVLSYWLGDPEPAGPHLQFFSTGTAPAFATRTGDRDVDFSPSGDRVAFTGAQAGRGWAVYVAAADGSGRVKVADGYGADWRPAAP